MPANRHDRFASLPPGRPFSVIRTGSSKLSVAVDVLCLRDNLWVRSWMHSDPPTARQVRPCIGRRAKSRCIRTHCGSLKSVPTCALTVNNL